MGAPGGKAWGVPGGGGVGRMGNPRGSKTHPRVQCQAEGVGLNPRGRSHEVAKQDQRLEMEALPSPGGGGCEIQEVGLAP